MDIVDVIVENVRYDKGNKLIKLYAVIMLNYRQELGDKAWDAIKDLFNGDASLVSSFSFLCGYLTGMTKFDSEQFEKFISTDLKVMKNLT